MWREYSIKHIKNNKASSIFLAVISLISTMFLSLLCSMAYNLWIDHINQIIFIEGSYTKRPEPLVMAYGFVILAACISLIIMIHNAFEVPMNNRIHQLGILQSVGATPKQIKSFLLQEVMTLCFIPILCGILLGIGVSYLLVETVITITADVREYQAAFHFHIMVFVMSFVVSALTVLLSAWIPAKKVSKLTPLEALGYGIETGVTKMKKFRYSKIWGVHGELARKSIYARRKELRTSTFSLFFAFFALIGLLNIEIISGISTQFTYFERYRDKWDMVLTTKEYSENLLEKIEKIEGIESCISYRKAMTDTTISEQKFSQELKEIGIENLTEMITLDMDNNYVFSVPIYFLDNYSFEKYCTEQHITQTDAVVINKIWDSLHSNRKYREYIPLIDMQYPLNIDLAGNELNIDSYTAEMPRIREEYKQYSLTLIASQNLYDNLVRTLPVSEATYNIDLTSAIKDKEVQEQIKSLLQGYGEYSLESRMESEQFELKMRSGMKAFIWSFTAIIACIGVANIFSFTLGQIMQRRKEFARYFAIGLSGKGMRKILFMEAIIICLRPLLLSVIINAPLVTVLLSAAYISVPEYLSKAPFMLVILFVVTVIAFVMFAYYLGSKKICNSDLVEVIKDETML